MLFTTTHFKTASLHNMTYNTIIYTSANKICTITLNRPEKRNAFNAELVAELKQAFAAAEHDSEVKVIVLKGNGEVFSAGADLAYLQSLQKNNFQENLDDSASLMELYKQIYTLSKPVIAQIEGHAIAGGCGLASVCDFAYAVDEAKFGYTEVRIGFVPAIVMVFLLRKINERNAKELLLTGKLISAQEAKHFGLINDVVGSEMMQETIDTICADLINNASRASLKATKQMIAAVQEMRLEEALFYAAEVNAKARATADCKHGIQSFLDKQKPNWD
jgi:methylglutaconyl-CoA hydratase